MCSGNIFDRWHGLQSGETSTGWEAGHEQPLTLSQPNVRNKSQIMAGSMYQVWGIALKNFSNSMNLCDSWGRSATPALNWSGRNDGPRSRPPPRARKPFKMWKIKWKRPQVKAVWKLKNSDQGEKEARKCKKEIKSLARQKVLSLLVRRSSAEGLFAMHPKWGLRWITLKLIAINRHLGNETNEGGV